MINEHASQIKFFSEISERQISAQEFFSSVLLDSLNKNLGYENVVISYFDTKGRFLSWINRNGIMIDGEDHPYRAFAGNDIIRHKIYQDAVADKLTYFNVTPRLYQATDMISSIDYDCSPYVCFLEQNFQAHYSVTMAFGINAYIQVAFLKDQGSGDFTAAEIAALNEIYVYIANAYKNFKKHEQAKIVSNIQNEIISSGEKAYLVTDDFMHIMSYNQTAKQYLADILGSSVTEQISSTSPCSWLPFLLGGDEGEMTAERVHTRVIRDYIFKIYTYDQSYSNGIIDRYHWITISQKDTGLRPEDSATMQLLTQTEQRVAGLMYKGLTYQAIADEMVVSYHTIKKHVQNIYTKCSVKSRFELYKWLENTKE